MRITRKELKINLYTKMNIDFTKSIALGKYLRIDKRIRSTCSIFDKTTQLLTSIGAERY